MTLGIPLSKNRFVTVLSVYGPTLDSSEDVFSQQLDSTLQETPRTDKIILLGDLNARVGRDSHAWPNVLGNHGIGNMNSNGLRLLMFCSEHQLAMTSTYFQLPAMHITRQRDLSDVLVSRARRGAECWTDHHMNCSKMKLVVRPPARRCAPKTRLNVNSLSDPTKRLERQELLI